MDAAQKAGHVKCFITDELSADRPPAFSCPPAFAPGDAVRVSDLCTGVVFSTTGSDLRTGSEVRTGSDPRTGSDVRTESDVRTGSDLRTGFPGQAGGGAVVLHLLQTWIVVPTWEHVLALSRHNAAAGPCNLNIITRCAPILACTVALAVQIGQALTVTSSPGAQRSWHAEGSSLCEMV